MNCPYCHQETEDAAAFCTRCGRYIPRCPTCGKVITARIAFCTRDGTPLPEELTRDLPEAENTVAEMPEQQSAPGKNGGTTAVLIVAIVIVVALVVAAVLWTQGMLGQSDDEVVEENQTTIVEETAEPEADSVADTGESAEPDETLADEAEDEEETEQVEQIDISLTTDQLTINVGMTYQIIGANADQVSWTYSEPGIVEVDGSGQLTALTAGTTVATATGPNGETDSVEITVLAAETEETAETEEQEEPESTEDTDVDDADVDLSGDYLLPESSSRYLSESELYGLTALECRIARNEIYARHGMIFTTDEMKEYFGSKSWYQGTVESADFDISVFNEYELANIELIVAYEKEMNYNQAN
ncbi:MAG: YARHG domain-containing protein [Clostridiales bacterium]|nr:YARHG domain-containing protein [Clostridiales bacterium]